MSEGNAVLRMDAVTKVYGSGEAAVFALDKVDFEAYPGEVVVVMGPSGAGKTTFLTIAGALLRPTEGRVEIAGTEITSLKENRLPFVRRERVGFIFQNFNLLEALTGLENVRLVMMDPDSRGSVNRARELLEMFGLGHRLNSLPKNLSGGEKQRVGIARALANNPDLILADEPTANLDSKRGQEVMQLLRQIALELHRTVVIVSHDHRIREVAHRVLWLEDGRFRADVITERDPVCGRPVEVEGARTVEYEGSTYYFCADQCLKLFEATPRRFLEAVEE
ncbi:MAG: ATP-binding cassette domain-containing protein [Chloroflexi bacterium]|nr:ATP-binding cassette domain-containing protein [Chloroflexota bacterium]